MDAIRGTPAYWEKNLLRGSSNGQTVRSTNVFTKLSCAGLRLNELILIIATLRDETLTDNNINKMDFFDRCSFLNLNAVLLARHFQYRKEVFFQVIV